MAKKKPGDDQLRFKRNSGTLETNKFVPFKKTLRLALDSD